ncbi:hypothetical protein Trydic_g21428 [Trypoxylus dichotomus]
MFETARAYLPGDVGVWYQEQTDKMKDPGYKEVDLSFEEVKERTIIVLITISTKMKTEIDEFFENTNILITGGTGFMGKVLVEKLLRSQSNINKIYLLIRSKKGKLIEDRVKKDVFDQPVFEKVKEMYPTFMEKIAIIPGDISKPELGLSEQDKLILQNEINIVFNSAASLNMNGSLKDNIKSNLIGVLELLDLCRNMKNLKSVVIISTAYSNVNRKVIPEKICKSTLNPDLVIRMCDELDSKTLEKITPLILDGHPNTYTFSKSLMENVLQRYKDLPIVLFRPALVMPAYKEPLFGWVDNFNGIVGMCLANGLGILRVVYVGSENRGNWVPVDTCTNALICSAAHGIRNRKSADDIAVYNYACGKNNKRWVDLLAGMHNSPVKLYQCIWMPWYTCTDTLFKFRFLCFFLHFLPALLIDPILALSGSKLRLMKIYNERIYSFVDVFSFFAVKEWTMHEENTEQMWRDLTQAEQEKYFFDINSIDFNTLIESICSGVKVYLAKEKIEDNFKAARKQKIFAVAHYTLLLLLISGMLWITLIILRQF